MKTEELFPSKYLKAANLKGQDVELTIARLEIEEGLDDDGQADHYPVLYFAPPATKGLRLNRTNTDAIAAVYGEETDDWIGKAITLFPTTTNYKGKPTPCIRVRVTQQQAAAGIGAAEVASDAPEL